MKKNVLRITLFLALTLCVLTFSVYALACPHNNQTSIISIEATCTENGEEHIVCLDCESILSKIPIPATGHKFGEYILTTLPTQTNNGIETATCSHCGETDNREYICPHSETHISILEEASCSKVGQQAIICNLCSVHMEVQEIEMLSCEWGDWIESKYATPFEDGIKIRTCHICEKTETESYSMSMPSDNSIYIPATGICHPITVTKLSQSSVDNYDLVYDVNFFGSKGPWILGHRYGTLGLLPNVKVGQNIYISVNGNIKTYIVRYSEFAMQNPSWTDIVGQTSGLSVLSSLEKETLHMYTCYGETKNHRWMVLAELV